MSEIPTAYFAEKMCIPAIHFMSMFVCSMGIQTHDLGVVFCALLVALQKSLIYPKSERCTSVTMEVCVDVCLSYTLTTLTLLARGCSAYYEMGFLSP